MPRKQVNGINVYYEIHGEGQPLLLISGLGQDHTVWYPILDKLKSTFQVILFDNRGSGQTDSPDVPYTTEIMARDAMELLKSLNIEKSFVVGHSMGGLIGQQLAIHYSSFVSKLVLYSTYAHMGSRARKLIEFTREFFELGAVDAAFKYIVTQIYSDKFLADEVLVDQILEVMKKNPYPQTPVGYLHQFEACFLHDTRTQLNLIKTPTLVIGGKRDILSMQEEAIELCEGINAEIKLFPFVAHVAHLELPSDFSKDICQFLTAENTISNSLIKEEQLIEEKQLPDDDGKNKANFLYFSRETPSIFSDKLPFTGQKRARDLGVLGEAEVTIRRESGNELEGSQIAKRARKDK